MSSGPPPPYPGNEDNKGNQAYGYGAPYPPQDDYKQAGFQPQQAGYPPPNVGYAAPPGYNQPQPGGYPPPQAGYPHQAGYPPPHGYAQSHGQNTTVVVAQPPITLVQTFGSVPVRTGCPHCRADIITATHFESGTFSWVVCVVLCLVGCDLGCCLIPFCVESCQDVVHTCPNCHQHIARWNRM